MNIHYQSEFERAKELYINGLSIRKSCEKADITYYRFMSMIRPEEYAELTKQQEDKANQIKHDKMEILVNKIFTHLASGVRITEAVAIEGSYLHVITRETTKEQRKKLAYGKYLGELERIKKEQETHYNKKNVRNT